MHVRHFLQFKDFELHEFEYLFERARTLKARQARGELYQPLIGKTMAMIFEKSSTRTRVSFEAGMNQLGGSAMFLSPRDTQLARGEPIEDEPANIMQNMGGCTLRTWYNIKGCVEDARHGIII